MDTHLPHTPALNFGPYHLDGLNGLLWQGPRVIPMSPKVTDVLWQLVSHAGYLVSKAELLQAVWPKTAMTDGVLREQSRAVPRRQQAKSLELRAAMSLARLWHQQGKSKAAQPAPGRGLWLV